MLAELREFLCELASYRAPFECFTAKCLNSPYGPVPFDSLSSTALRLWHSIS